jgi:hypothetical protein
VSEGERYLELGLRLGRHVDGLVDSYYGPPELKQHVDAEDLVPAETLAGDADSLLGELPDGWLRDQVHGLATYARVLAGEPISYSDEVEACYGVRPQRFDEDVYRAAHEQLDALLPGDGSLLERREAWRDANQMPSGRLMPVLDDVLAELRRRTAELFGLAEGEEMFVEEVHDEPWWAFNYYLGGLRSRVVVNVDVPTTYDDLLDLAAHEAYPGHHTERSTKERLLVRERGLIDETINLVPTPQSLLAEGIAETAYEILGEEAREATVAIMRQHGISYDAEHAREVRRAFTPMRRLGVDAALLVHEDGATEEQAKAHLMRWGVLTEKRATQSIRFVLDPTWRAYVITYSSGGELARAYHGGDPAKFKELLEGQVRARDLVAAAASAH